MAGIEEAFVNFLLNTKFDDLPEEARTTAENMFLTIMGTTIAGATLEGVDALRDQIKHWGGREEATILLWGDRVPAHHAALLNSYMARALDCDDGIRPGMHVGASAVPAALSASEMAGGCSGKELLTSLVLGGEIADRINLVSKYDGFDPTGICSIFAATAIACRILSLDREKTWHALSIAFNRSGGSFQSNIEGSLSVRLIQGFVAEGAILSAQLANRGFTGPKAFLEGTYGYFHLYAKDRYDIPMVIGDLGRRFEFCKTMFKKYPSCGDTISSTEAMLELVREHDIRPDDVSQIDIKVTPYAYKLVGGPFQIGQNPRVNAQFSIRYCVANALLRRGSRLEHFEEAMVRDPKIMEIVQKVHVEADPLLEERDETAVEMRVLAKSGAEYRKRIDVAAGFAERPLTREEILERFWNCIDYAKKPLPKRKVEKLVSMLQKLEELEDIRSLIPLMLW
ncbi:MAG: MmgE/PrpD family protein [Syntrophaceae bacterium]|nr:MmgE/PrpD family protein [Syntrophaceae bacterium]